MPIEDSVTLQRIEKIIYYCKLIKNKLETSARDYFDFDTSIKLLSMIQDRLVTAQNEVYQYVQFDNLNFAVQTLQDTLQNWYTELQVYQKEQVIDPLQYAPQLAHAAFIQYVIAFCDARIVHNYQLTDFFKTSELDAVLSSLWHTVPTTAVQIEDLSLILMDFFEVDKVCDLKNINADEFKTFLFFQEKNLLIHQYDLQFLAGTITFLVSAQNPGRTVDFLSYENFDQNGPVLEFQHKLTQNIKSRMTTYQYDTQLFNNDFKLQDKPDYHRPKFTKIGDLISHVKSVLNPKLINFSLKSVNVREQNSKVVEFFNSIIHECLKPENALVTGLLSVPTIADYVYHINQTSIDRSAVVGLNVLGIQVEENPTNINNQIIELLKQDQYQISPKLLQKLSQQTLNCYQKRFLTYRNPKQTLIRTANAAPFIVIRLIQRELRKELQRQLQQTNKHTLLKMVKQVSSIANATVTELLLTVKEINESIVKYSDKDILLQIFQASEAEQSMDQFTFTEQNGSPSEMQEFILSTQQKLLAIGLNFSFLSFVSLDLKISQISGVLCPFGGFACKLGLQFVNKLIERWSGFECATVSFQTAANCLIELINAKDGCGSQIFEQIAKLRRVQNGNQAHSFFISLINKDVYQQQSISKIQERQANYYRQFANVSVDFLAQNVKSAVDNLLNVPYHLNKLFCALEAAAKCSGKSSALFPTQTLSADFAKLVAASQIAPWKTPQICIIGLPQSGASSLVQHLIFAPLFRFASVSEALGADPVKFLPSNLISDPFTVSAQPWQVLISSDLMERIGKKQKKPQFQIQGLKDDQDDIVSVGSWLSVDSQNLLQNATQSEENKSDEGMVNLNISKFLDQIKSQNLLGEKEKKEQKQAVAVPESSSDHDKDHIDIMQISTTYNESYLGKTFLDYKQSKQEQFDQNKQLKYMDILTEIPTAVYSSVDQELKRNIILAQSGKPDPMINQELAKKYEQNQKTQIPLINFARFCFPHTQTALKYSVPLIKSFALDVFDIPAQQLGLSNNLVTTKFVEQRDSLTKQIHDQTQVYNDQLKQLAVYIPQLLEYFTKQVLPAQFLQQQQQFVQTIHNKQTNSINSQSLSSLTDVIYKQKTQVQKELEAKITIIKDYQQKYELMKQAGQLNDTVNAQFQTAMQQLQAQLKPLQLLFQQLTQQSQLCQNISNANNSLQQLAQNLLMYQNLLKQVAVEISKCQLNSTQMQQIQKIIHDSSLLIFTYDTTASVQSFSDHLKHYILEQQKLQSNILVVGVKSDLEKQFWNHQSIENVLNFCAANSLSHVFCSNLAEEGVNDLIRATILKFLVNSVTEMPICYQAKGISIPQKE